MTINKSQCQSVKHVGLNLSSSVFTHGQFYVAVSRVKSVSNIKVIWNEQEEEAVTKTLYIKRFFLTIMIIRIYSNVYIVQYYGLTHIVLLLKCMSHLYIMCTVFYHEFAHQTVFSLLCLQMC